MFHAGGPVPEALGSDVAAQHRTHRGSLPPGEPCTRGAGEANGGHPPVGCGGSSGEWLSLSPKHTAKYFKAQGWGLLSQKYSTEGGASLSKSNTPSTFLTSWWKECIPSSCAHQDGPLGGGYECFTQKTSSPTVSCVHEGGPQEPLFGCAAGGQLFLRAEPCHILCHVLWGNKRYGMPVTRTVTFLWTGPRVFLIGEHRHRFCGGVPPLVSSTFQQTILHPPPFSWEQHRF